MEYSSPLQWRSRGKVIVAESETISIWDVNSLTPQPLLSVATAGKKINCLHMNNTDAEIGGGVHQRCKSYERAKKKLTVLEAPNVLTIALKRFQSGKFGKLNKAVRFPEILDLKPYMSGTDDKSPVYSLYAVVVHQDIMNAAFSGHYVCYVKSMQGKWYETDDSKVKPVAIGSVLMKNAYMLLYARLTP